MLIGTRQPGADDVVLIGFHFADLQLRRVLAQFFQIADNLIDELEVWFGKRRLVALQGENDAARVDVLREGLFQQAKGAQAGEAFRQEADVVVLGARVPVRRGQGEADAQNQPTSANRPRILGRDPSQVVEHVRRILRGQPQRPPERRLAACSKSRARESPMVSVMVLLSSETPKV